jgi:hypothetical protein
MLIENKNIDEIFRDKLKDYEKTPPVFLWTSIQEGLNARKRKQRILLMKTIGIAAAILLAFIAGWQMTNSPDKDTKRINSFSEQVNIGSKVNPSTKTNKIITDNQSINTNQADTANLIISPGETGPNSLKLSSIAAFAPNTSFIGNNMTSEVSKSNELELFNTEKDFLDKFHQNFKMVKKLTDWVASLRKDSLISSFPNTKTMITSADRINSAKSSVEVATFKPERNNSHWSLKAEFTPTFNSQAQSGGSKTDFVTNNVSQNSKPQKTTAENTLSGGMVAGYKVGKRLVVKSGIIYNNIRQTTSNIDLIGVNPLYSVPGNATLASTPAGQVSLSKVGSNSADAVLNSKYQLDNPSKYASEVELKQDFGFIEIPLQVTYKLINSKFNMGLTGGVSTNILVGNNVILSENGEKISTGETANMRSIVYSGAIGLEVGYEITSRISLTVEPRIKHFINSLSTSKSVDYKPLQMGFVTGLTYSFN